MPEIFVELDVETQHNDDADLNPNNEPYRYQGSSSSWLNGVRAFTKDWSRGHATYRRCVEVSFEPIPGATVFIVIVKYTTGGTFEHGEDFKIVAAFDKADKAIELRELIETDYREYKEKYNHLEFDGVEYYTGTWKGYFEHLLDVRIETEWLRLS